VKQGRDAHSIISLLLIGCFGALMIGIFSRRAGSSGSVFSVAIMIAVASMLAGGLVGFLFGIPGTIQQAREGEDTSLESQQSENKPLTYAPNTNLEQISDWLTKILGRCVPRGRARRSRKVQWLMAREREKCSAE
jgi:hypothetical protein